jgi:hypothetical protein
MVKSPSPASARAPQSSVAARSHAEIQKMLRAEIDSLSRTLDERFSEIVILTNRLNELRPSTPKEFEELLAEQERRHKLEIVLVHALYASWHKGPAPGVLKFEEQVRLLQESDLFNAAWYLETYPDTVAGALSPQEHYVRSGAFEGRNPGPDFDSFAYYLANPDVAQAGWPALVHYVGFGRAEGRRIG